MGSIPMRSAAIIAAAGIGRRMGGDRPKQYLELGHRPIICHTLERFREAALPGGVVIVVEPGREQTFYQDILQPFDAPKNWKIVVGGGVRQESVHNGLKALSPECDVVLVHDGVRPFITPMQIRQAADEAEKHGACILATPIKETIKRVDASGNVVETIDRSQLWGAQTPQAFRRSLLQEAMTAATYEGFIGTDEASLVERLGHHIRIIPGDARNIKMTSPEDFTIAEGILKEWR